MKKFTLWTTAVAEILLPASFTNKGIETVIHNHFNFTFQTHGWSLIHNLIYLLGLAALAQPWIIFAIFIAITVILTLLLLFNFYQRYREAQHHKIENIYYATLSFTTLLISLIFIAYFILQITFFHPNVLNFIFPILSCLLLIFLAVKVFYYFILTICSIYEIASFREIIPDDIHSDISEKSFLRLKLAYYIVNLLLYALLLTFAVILVGLFPPLLIVPIKVYIVMAICTLFTIMISYAVEKYFYNKMELVGEKSSPKSSEHSDSLTFGSFPSITTIKNKKSSQASKNNLPIVIDVKEEPQDLLNNNENNKYRISSLEDDQQPGQKKESNNQANKRNSELHLEKAHINEGNVLQESIENKSEHEIVDNNIISDNNIKAEM